MIHSNTQKYFCIIIGSDVSPISPYTVSTTHNIRRIEMAVREPVDEANLSVLDLESAGYTVEESIGAVEKYGTLEAALIHLQMSTFEKDDAEGETGVIPLPYQHQLSKDDSQEDFNIEWYLYNTFIVCLETVPLTYLCCCYAVIWL